MVSLTFYGGVNEIGGNKVLVESGDGNVLLDFGRRMGVTGQYYSEFLQLRSNNALRDFLRLGVVPRLDGVYYEPYLKTSSMLVCPVFMLNFPYHEAPDYWDNPDITPCNPEKPRVDGVFISHAHFDHIQDVSFLDPVIPIYCTEETKVLANVICDISTMHIDDQFFELRKDQEIKPVIPDSRSDYRVLFPGELDYYDKPEYEKKIVIDDKTGFSFTRDYEPKKRCFKTELYGKVNEISYKLIPVDHSIPGACSVLMKFTDGTRILYTGDYRFKSRDAPTIDEYVSSVGEHIDVLITEGTRIDNETVLEEEKILKEIKEDIKGKDGLVLVNFNWKDLTRYNLLLQVAQELDRVLVITNKLAYLLYEMHLYDPQKYQDPRKTKNLKVYVKREGSLLYQKRDYDKYRMGYLHNHGRNSALDDCNLVRIAERLGKGGRENNVKNPLPLTDEQEPYSYKEIMELATHHIENGVRAYQIRENPEKYILMFSYWDSNELFDLIPDKHSKPSAYYLAASTEPFNDEMQIDEEKFMNWLEKFDVYYESEIIHDDETERDRKIFLRRHISGHASQSEIVELIEKLKPKKIIPIHTAHPSKFKELFPNYNIIEPNYNELITI